jgi:hypothetical protein
MSDIPKGVIIRAIEDQRHPLDDMVMETERSRFVCLPCTREVHALVLCDGPICRRCTRPATIQKTLNASEAIPEPVSPECERLTKVMGWHQGQGHFQLPKVKPKPKDDKA